MRGYLTFILPLEIEMGMQERITTVISTKGQVILPLIYQITRLMFR